MLENGEQPTHIHPTSGENKRSTDFFGYPYKWYWKRIRSVVVGLILFEIVVSVLLVSGVAGESLQTGIQIVTLPIEILLFILIAWKTRDGQGIPWRRAAAVGIMAGAILGVSMAVVKLFVLRQHWTLFNLFTEPIFTALAGALICSATAILINKILASKKSSTKI